MCALSTLLKHLIPGCTKDYNLFLPSLVTVHLIGAVFSQPKNAAFQLRGSQIQCCLAFPTSKQVITQVKFQRY